MPFDIAKFKTLWLNGIKVDRKKFVNLVTRLAPLADQTVRQYIIDTGKVNLKKTEAAMMLMNNKRFMNAFFGELPVASSVDFYWGPETWQPEPGASGFNWNNIFGVVGSITNAISAIFGSKKPENISWQEYWAYLQQQQKSQQQNLTPILLIGGGLFVFILIFMIIMVIRR